MAQSIFVQAHTKHNIHRDYASVIVSYPRTVPPLNRTRLDKAHVHRRVCKLAIYVHEVYAKEITSLLLLCSHSPNDAPSESHRNVSIADKSHRVYSNSRNDVPRVAQRYGSIAAHTRRRASVLVVYVVFWVHVYSFAGLIRRTPPPTFSDTAITDRHSDTTIFQLRAHWVRISWSIGSEKSFEHVPPVGVEPSTSCVLGEHPIH